MILAPMWRWCIAALPTGPLRPGIRLRPADRAVAPQPDPPRSFFRGILTYAHRDRSLPMDMLRGIAILLVLGLHYIVPPEGLGPLQPLAVAWKTIGWAGVDLFFVLSGFLVSGLIFAEYRKNRDVGVGRFIIRRGFKIWPPYFAYLAFIALWLGWQQWRGQPVAVWSALWPNLLHVQNYFHSPRIHTWSLAVEEHFYLSLALVVWLLLRSRRLPALLRHLPVFTGALVLILAGLRHAAFLRAGPGQLNLYATHLRFDGLLIGTLLAYWTHFHPARLAPFVRHPVALIVVGAVLAAPTLFLTPDASAWAAGIGLTGVYAGFGSMVLGWMNLRPTAQIFSVWPAAFLGQIGFYSYSIYLWHIDLAQTPLRKLLEHVDLSFAPRGVVWLAVTAVYVAAAAVTGMLLARLFEGPSLALRDRLFPGAAKPMARKEPARPMPPALPKKEEAFAPTA